MDTSLLWLPFVIAALDWLAVARGWTRVQYLTKPGTMLALLLWMWAAGRAAPGGAAPGGWGWFLAAGAASLAGDVFLMLPREQFIPGLVSFLLAHVAYVVGLNQSPPPFNLVALVLVFAVGMVAGRIYLRVKAGLAASGHMRLHFPVLLYSTVISLMLISALFTLVRPEWPAFAALLVSAGAFLFFLSDTLLAWNRFVTPLPNARLKVRIPYHLGQITLVAGAGLYLLAGA